MKLFVKNKILFRFFLLILVIYIMSLKVVYVLLLTSFGNINNDIKKCSSIVVLGGRDDYDRVLKGLELAHVYDDKILIMSGVHNKYKNVIRNFGLSKVIFEDESTNTNENALFTKNLLMEYNDICLVSAEAHLFRASKTFEKLGMHTHLIPSNKINREIKLHHFLPDLKYFVLNKSIIYEYLAFIKYHYQGRV